MRKRLSGFVSLFILLIPLSILTSCKKKPWTYIDVVWSSQQPEMEITKRAGESNLGYMVVDGNNLPIILLWGPTLSFYILKVYEDGTIDTITDETSLLAGRVNYSLNTAILTIMVDNVFNNEFKKIVLTKRDL